MMLMMMRPPPFHTKTHPPHTTPIQMLQPQHPAASMSMWDLQKLMPVSFATPRPLHFPLFPLPIFILSYYTNYLPWCHLRCQFIHGVCGFHGFHQIFQESTKYPWSSLNIHGVH